jgi:hypothetical protein
MSMADDWVLDAGLRDRRDSGLRATLRRRCWAQRDRHGRIEFTVGIGGAADINGRAALANSAQLPVNCISRWDAAVIGEATSMLPSLT